MKIAIQKNILYPEITLEMWNWMRENSNFLPSDEDLKERYLSNDLDSIKQNYFKFATDDCEFMLRTNKYFIECIKKFKPKYWKIIEIDDDLTIDDIYIEVDEISEVVKENHREWF